jgi:hypothetical protein
VCCAELQAPKPTSQHIIDDAGVLNRTTKKAVNDELTRFEVGTRFSSATCQSGVSCPRHSTVCRERQHDTCNHCGSICAAKPTAHIVHRRKHLISREICHRADFAAAELQTSTIGVTVPLQIEHGYRLEVVTVRKLEFENDAFGFADKVIEKCARFLSPSAMLDTPTV